MTISWKNIPYYKSACQVGGVDFHLKRNQTVKPPITRRIKTTFSTSWEIVGVCVNPWEVFEGLSIAGVSKELFLWSLIAGVSKEFTSSFSPD